MAYHHVQKRVHQKALSMYATGGYTKAEIAKACKVSYQTVLNWTKGQPTSRRKRSYSGKVKLYKCQECGNAAEGMLRGKWLCADHRLKETQAVAIDLNNKLAASLGVEVVAETPIIKPEELVEQLGPPSLTQEAIDSARGLTPERTIEKLQELHRNAAQALEHGEGVKYDGGKARMDLVDWAAIEGLAKVLEFGARKYSPNNWRNGMEWGRILAAAMRHLADFAMGRDLDKDSGLPVIDHAMCCLMFLSSYQKTGTGTDDRWKPSAV